MSLPLPPSCSLYDRVFDGLSAADAHRPAITEVDTGKHVTYGELRAMIDAFIAENGRDGSSRG